MANILPDELIFVILSFLTVDSLLRFRCVSKKWRDLIDSPGFAKYHLHQSTTTRASVFNIVFDYGHHSYGSVKMDKRLNESGDLVVEEFIYPYQQMPYGRTHILSSCNGLLCVYDYFDACNVTLLNPLTRKYRTLPYINVENSINAKPDFRWYLGFGYDSENDDYKVLKMSLVTKPTLGWMYSLRLGAWRRLDNLPNYCFTDQTHGKYVSNAIHWLVNDPARFIGALESDNGAQSRSIGAFDLVTEEFRLVPLPENQTDECFQLEVVDGCLCVCYTNRGFCVLDWWIMREYGAKDSWSRVSEIFHFSNTLMMTLKPLVFSEDEKLLLCYVMVGVYVNNGGLMWYDLETESFKRRLDEPPNFVGGDLLVHIPSLVNPNHLDGY